MRFLSRARPALIFRASNGAAPTMMGAIELLKQRQRIRVAVDRNMGRLFSNSNDANDDEDDNNAGRRYSVHDSFDDSLMDQYDAFILDQFGVLHNGVAALEGAVELCEYLHRQKKKKLIVLSNTSAPADKALAKLPKLGFDASLFCGAVTSGEEASRYIRATFGSGSATRKPTKVLMLTWDVSIGNNPRLTATPEAFLEQCGRVQVATSIEEADFLLLHGSEVWYRGGAGSDSDGSGDQQQLQQESLGNFIETGDFAAVDPILQVCLDRGLKLVCANPDLIVQTPTGGTAYMPGQIARRYQEMGGDCTIFGKPAAEHFEACVKRLGDDDNENAAPNNMQKSRVCHVGDSLHHDIFGANRAGISTIFVTSGIHRHELETDFGVLPNTKTLDRVFREEGDIVPTHVVPAFRL